MTDCISEFPAGFIWVNLERDQPLIDAFSEANPARRAVKKRLRPARRREHVHRVTELYAVSERRALQATGWPRSSHRYQSRAADTTALRLRMRELATSRPRFGYSRLLILLRREGWVLNHKKCFRLYREEGLTLRYKRKKRKYTSEVRVPPAIPERRDQRWTIDFVSDSTSSGQAFRVLTAVDVKTRECVLLDPSIRFPSSRVTLALDRLIAKGRKPDVITLDNGTEFTCEHFDAWAYQRGIQLDFIRPGRPAENCHIELFNGRLRDECLNVHWWKSVDEARTVLEDWRRDYNEVRPHSSLSDLVPAEYVARLLGLTPAGMKERQLTG